MQHVLPALKSSFVHATYAQLGVPKALIELVAHDLLPPLTVLPSAHDIGLTQQMPPSVNSESTQPEPAHSVVPELSRVVEQRRKRERERVCVCVCEEKREKERKRKLDIFNWKKSQPQDMYKFLEPPYKLYIRINVNEREIAIARKQEREKREKRKCKREYKRQYKRERKKILKRTRHHVDQRGSA